MSERYITRRSFAVMVNSLRKAHSSLVVPGEVQPACREQNPTPRTALGARDRGPARILGRVRRCRGAGRLTLVNTWCRVAATSMLATTPVLAQNEPTPRPGTPAERVVAEPVVPVPAPAAASPRAGSSTPALTPAGALAVFETVRGWVDRGAVPQDLALDLPRSWVTTVVIRRGDRVIGRDTSVAGDETDAARTIQRAAARAIRRAAGRLEGEPDALRPERLRVGLAGSRVSIEMAPSPAVPVSADVGLTNLDEWVRPGIEGLLVRRGSDIAASTPGLMLATGRGASGSFVGLVSELADDPSIALRPADELFKQGFSLSLFNVVHVAQISPGAAPLLLHRGGQIAGPVTSTVDVRTLADSIAGHIMRRAWPGVERHGLRGEYDPVTGRFDERIAPPFAQAFAAEALLRYADAPGVDPVMSARAAAAAETTLAALAVVEPTERAPWGESISAAACLTAVSRLDKLAVERSGELRTLRDQCLRQIHSAYSVNNGFDPLIPATARGVVARGLLAVAEFEPWDRDAHLLRADEAIRTVFRETQASQLLGVMPDLGWADIELARIIGGKPKSAVVLHDLRETVLDLKLRSDDLLGVDRDLLGGLVLDASGNPLPTWQSLRPLGLLATMLGDEWLTPGTIGTGEVQEQLIETLDMIRFVKQLTAEQRLGHMYADPDLAFGGVRASLWDQSMPLSASAIGLTAACETLESLERISTRRTPAAGRP